MPKGFSEHEKAAIRERLLAEGYKQFSAFGLKKTRVEELAAAARISTGAFYRFYESKEALFMDVAELAEQHYRKEILAAIEWPGQSPRTRLLAVFKHALALVKTIPILRPFTSSDYDLLFRRVPAEKLREHLASDQLFFSTLVERCRKAGIPIQARSEEIGSLLYPLVMASLYTDDLGAMNLNSGVDALLDLVAAYCLGEVKSSHE